jgi:hypothetical protein
LDGLVMLAGGGENYAAHAAIGTFNDKLVGGTRRDWRHKDG